VKHRPRIKKLAIELETTMLSGKRTPVIGTARMVEQQRSFGIPDELRNLTTAGLMNKQIAAELGVSEITAKIHSGNTMKKMGARSLADLVRMAEVLGIRRTQP
jgi:hypothetical protein